MTKSRPAPESVRLGLATACLLAALAAAPEPSVARPIAPPGHGLPGDTVLPQAVSPAARRAWMARQSALCLVAIAEAGARAGIPPGLLEAVSRVETGRALPVTGDRQPWPWSVNADGETLFYDTRGIAVVETARRLQGGARFVDIGCMQVDLRMHPRAFADLAEAFNPSTNATYAARLLASLHAGGRSWAQAAGLYHSATAGLMEPYRDGVARMRRSQRNSLSNSRDQ